MQKKSIILCQLDIYYQYDQTNRTNINQCFRCCAEQTLLILILRLLYDKLQQSLQMNMTHYVTRFFIAQNSEVYHNKINQMSLPTSDSLSKENQQSLQKKTLQDIRPWLYKRKKSRFGTRRRLTYNEQHWSHQQNAKYIQFLRLYMDLIKSDASKKRKYQLNRILSKFVGSRSPIQCRNHHLLMLKAHGSPQNIISQMSLELQTTGETQRLIQTQECSCELPEQGASMDDFQVQSFKNPVSEASVDLRELDSNEFIYYKFDDIFQS